MWSSRIRANHIIYRGWVLDRREIEELQSFLKEKGFFNHLQRPVDGKMGPQTIKALQRFLTENGLRLIEDGVMGEQTWRALQQFLLGAGFLKIVPEPDEALMNFIRVSMGTTTTPVQNDVKPYFAYGSNHPQQMKDRVRGNVSNNNGAYLNGYQLIFAGSSSRWGHGGVATILQKQNATVYGTLYYLTPEQFDSLDTYETGYTKGSVVVNLKNGHDNIEAITYFKDNTNSIRKPSDAYLRAISTNIQVHWPEKAQFIPLRNDFTPFR
jgi:gamma-glutamylcyclotransferase (GGCT)/AIG2-like uncharacterized protein YtfP